MPVEFTIQNVTVDTIPDTILFSGLTPISGTLPSFSTAPIVYVRAQSTKRFLYVDRTQTTTTQFVIEGGDVFGADPPYTVDLGIITTETTAAAAGVGTAVSYPYYCSQDDVQDQLVNIGQSFGASDNLNPKRLQRMISIAFAQINAALLAGGYQLPVTNSVKQLVSGALTASANVVTLNSVDDGSAFTVGDTVRIHNTTGSTYADEFTEVVSVDATNNLVDVLYLENSYDTNSTVEILTEGFKYLRSCNAIGAAFAALGGLTVGIGSGVNDKVDDLRIDFASCIQDIRDGNVSLKGLSVRNKVDSYQAVEDLTDPVFEIGDQW